MDALKNLVTNIPDWLKRLDELNGQIEQRQSELAEFSESQLTSTSSRGNDSAARSVKNRGSTESLKPRNDGDAHPGSPPPPPLQNPLEIPPAATATAAAEGGPTQDPAAEQQPPSSPAGSNTPSAIQRQTSRVKAAGQARARATLRKRQRTDSVISAEAAAPKYRSRSMIIVYYDSYVQSFFEELVKFVSSSRNMMRKAKMAAKVAQIKRMAEMDAEAEESNAEGQANPGLVPSEGAIAPESAAGTTAGTGETEIAVAGDTDGNKRETLKIPEAPLEASTSIHKEEPTLRYMSTRGMQPISRRTHTPGAAAAGRSSGFNKRASKTGDLHLDVYDRLDKGLERVQGICEHAAHQFLRDGDCGEEVTKIQGWLNETRDLADQEMERVKKEEPQALATPEDPSSKGRSFRRPNMRHKHVVGSQSKEQSKDQTEDLPKDPAGAIEVDEAIDDMDDDAPMPKLAYKSTRMMR